MNIPHKKHGFKFLSILLTTCLYSSSAFSTESIRKEELTIISNQLDPDVYPDTSAIVYRIKDGLQVEIKTDLGADKKGLFYKIPSLYGNNFILRIQQKNSILCTWNPLVESAIIGLPSERSGIITPHLANKKIIFIRIFTLSKFVVCKIRFELSDENLEEFEEEMHFIGAIN